MLPPGHADPHHSPGWAPILNESKVLLDTEVKRYIYLSFMVRIIGSFSCFSLDHHASSCTKLLRTASPQLPLVLSICLPSEWRAPKLQGMVMICAHCCTPLLSRSPPLTNLVPWDPQNRSGCIVQPRPPTPQTELGYIGCCRSAEDVFKKHSRSISQHPYQISKYTPSISERDGGQTL